MKLHLACGNRKLPNFINIDIRETCSTDKVMDVTALPFAEKSVETIYTCGFLEHLGKNNNLEFFRKTSWKDALRHWYKILKPGGLIFISTVDFEAVCKEYLENKDLESLIGITIGGQKNEEDLHGMLFDYKILKDVLSEIGFVDIQRYNWWEFEGFTENPTYDDHSASYLPHMDKENGRLMMLNMKAKK
jgi:predicted SAM-dependent methyltransferase